MLEIRGDQLRALDDSLQELFPLKCLEFLEDAAPAWFEARTPQQRRAFVDEITSLARQCHIAKEISIQKLMLYKLTYDFPVPLSKLRHDRLARAHFEEEYRLAQFLDALNAPREPVKITLEAGTV